MEPKEDCNGCTALDRFGLEVFKKLAENTELTKSIAQDTKDIYTALRGDLNNKGWLTRIEECETALKKYTGYFTWLIGAVTVGVLSFIGGLITGAIKVSF